MKFSSITVSFLFLGVCVLILKSPASSEVASAPAANPFFSRKHAAVSRAALRQDQGQRLRARDR